ncbi:carboxylate/amino acid/amine transporter [Aliivibrio fischeri]|uniref:EamA family transporter n=1 Tax=Aliivibrio fischeri TaxID=668 RepID=A0A844PGI1_ALIFS|nr:carboxylate/amino acid/amine transporter [Aliivibrio fischeri]MCE7534531.1 carboxylate/amino acid/amine transporter [Aliivibrio fischeri]MCE7557633.1 carboxylate/amino acid/amine transporter [Aliivibrio fischeri]MCE7564696.1 carboxylate/amino acid/amine transporter [Aliivibrio fischeri]MCE7576097.1 carboxylate/amino acid/amine transporter [Aliivibrio fischeri]MCE7588387.1 carboxylate/amino acid/amine transporter [Aliivibrio fischeri]
MSYLLSITLLWAFSFSLIGVYLAGQVDAWFSVLMRIGLATLVFLPFLRPKNISLNTALKLMAIGAIQLGLMYVFYYQSFLYLTVPEVLLFTVMTPIYITLLNDAFEGKFHSHFMISAVIATLGAIAIRYNGIDAGFLLGFGLVQGANLCFATGQVCYKRLMKDQEIEQKTVFGFFFIGAFIVASTCYLLFGNSEKLPTTSVQWGVLIYLGVIASGMGYFMWNKGATLVNVGVLAVMNNLLIPAGILVNLLIWNRDADILRLSIGGALILLALLVNQKLEKKHHQS